MTRNQKQFNKPKNQEVIGRVKRNADGFGFLIPDDPAHVDVYLPRHTMTGVMTDDRVAVKTKRESDGRFSGEVVDIVARANQQIVGCFQTSGDRGTIKDESHAWGEDLFIERADTKGAKDGQLVVVGIKTFPGDRAGFNGVVLEVLGEHGDPLLDSKQTLYTHKVPIAFSKEALAEAEALPNEVRESDWQGRVDLRAKKFVTIDGATARDFDDAVYAERDHDGFRVWVAIADVSAYVREGSKLDLDAYDRGTSVYFPDMVVPMLPEKLSNGLCSLNPNVPRLVMVSEMRLDHRGELLDSKIYEGVIQSHHRMIYGEVQDILEGFDNPKCRDVQRELHLMRDIAKILMKKRFAEGSLDLEIPEAQLLIDASGVPTDVVRGDRLFAHRLIEELMLLANVAVGRFIEASGQPGLYRVHEEPFPDALKTLEVMAHNWGIRARFSEGRMIQKELMKMLKAVEGKPEEHILSILTLRSMKQAKYSSENIGHFGLAFECYTHFTSPIRRYPDLVVHRVCKRILRRMGAYPADRMATIGVMQSACEQRSNKAERELEAIKRCRFMQRHVGEIVDGMITSIQKFGLFVSLRAYDIDGLVRLETLRDDRYQFNEERQILTGRHSGRVYKLGDEVKVLVTRADPEAQQIDFEFVEQRDATPVNRQTDRSDIQTRRTSAPDRGRVRETRVPQRAGAGKAGPVRSQKSNKKRRSRKSNRR